MTDYFRRLGAHDYQKRANDELAEPSEQERRSAVQILVAVIIGVLLCAAAVVFVRVAHAQEGPVLLVAAPELQGVYRGTVVMAVPLGGDVHVGVILNRPTELHMAELFPNHAPSAEIQAPLYLGGPDSVRAIFAMVYAGESPGPQSLMLMPGLWLVGGAAAIDNIIETRRDEARYYLGIVTWRRGELAEEIRQGMFTVRPVDKSDLFLPDTAPLYERLVPRKGQLRTAPGGQPHLLGDRLSKGVFYGPPLADDALVYALRGQADGLGPVPQAFRLAAEREEQVPARVARLFTAGSPAAIAGLVIAVVVDPLDRGLLRRRAHVGEEVLELQPAFADRDPAAAVIDVRPVDRVTASAQHGEPAAVHRRPLAAGVAAMAVLQELGGGGVLLQASARASVPGQQSMAALRDLRAANAHASPVQAVSALDYAKPPERLARQVNLRPHAGRDFTS